MLTRSGLGVALAGVVLLLTGWWWRYEELIGVGVAALLAVVVAVLAARVPQRIKITRLVETPRVARGNPIRVAYRLVNTSAAPVSPATLFDRCGPHTTEIRLPRVTGFHSDTVRGTIPTDRRGIFDVGPATVERLDPLGLGAGRRELSGSGVVVVHPRVYALRGPYGNMHTVHDEAVVRRSAMDPLSGFVSLRAYVDGDDPRLIHWPTTARVGSLMVREHVELRRPEFTVVLDAAAAVASPPDFEEMADTVASIAVYAIRNGVTVSLRTTSRDHLGRPAFDSETGVLDYLTPIHQVGADSTASLSELFRTGLDHTTIVVITGPGGPSTHLVATSSLSVVRVGEGAELAPGIALAVDDADTFSRRWRAWQ